MLSVMLLHNQVARKQPNVQNVNALILVDKCKNPD